MNNEKIFLSWLSPLNFILACLVVFIHSYNANSYYLQYNQGVNSIILWFEDIISQNVAHIAVPLFFAISGYLYFRNLSFENINDKLRRRIKTLVFPYIIWNAIYLLLFYSITHISFISNSLNSTETVNMNLNTILSSLLFYKYNYIMWFIYQLILYVFIISPLFLFFLNKKYVASSLIIVLGLIYSNVYLECPNLSAKTMFIGIYPDMLSYFLFGRIFSVFRKVKNVQSRTIKISAIVLFLLSQVIWFYNHGEYKVWHSYALNYLFCLISVSSILLHISATKQEYISNIISSKYSFFIFTIHPFLLECIQKVFYLCLPHNELTALVDYICSPVITIAICIIIAYSINKTSFKLYKILGGR